eukprot:gene13311-biopygen15570
MLGSNCTCSRFCVAGSERYKTPCFKLWSVENKGLPPSACHPVQDCHPVPVVLFRIATQWLPSCSGLLPEREAARLPGCQWEKQKRTRTGRGLDAGRTIEFKEAGAGRTRADAGSAVSHL